MSRALPEPQTVADPGEARRIADDLFKRGRRREAGAYMARALVIEIQGPAAPVVDLAEWRRRRPR